MRGRLLHVHVLIVCLCCGIAAVLASGALAPAQSKTKSTTKPGDPLAETLAMLDGEARAAMREQKLSCDSPDLASRLPVALSEAQALEAQARRLHDDSFIDGY